MQAAGQAKRDIVVQGIGQAPPIENSPADPATPVEDVTEHSAEHAGERRTKLGANIRLLGERLPYRSLAH
jgi:hypothetical protein